MSLRRTSVISEVAVSRDWGRIEGWPVTAGWKWHLISWGGCRGAGRTGREDGGGGGVAISSPLFIRGEGQFLFSQVSSGNLWGLYWAYKYSQIHRPWSEIRSVKYLVLSLTERNLEYMQSQFNEFISDWCGLVLLFPLGGGACRGALPLSPFWLEELCIPMWGQAGTFLPPTLFIFLWEASADENYEKWSWIKDKYLNQLLLYLLLWDKSRKRIRRSKCVKKEDIF